MIKVTFYLTAVTMISRAPASATMWDLRTEWSDVANPSGAWSYRTAAGQLLTSMTCSGNNSEWNGIQCAWNALPTTNVFQATATLINGNPNWLPGDIVAHSPAMIRWTSPVDTTIQIDGGVWLGRDNFQRATSWTLLLNGAAISSGIVSSNDIYDRNSPFLFALGSGGLAALQNIHVTPGTTIDLVLVGADNTGALGEYTAMNMAIGEVPEPGTAVLSLLGLCLWLQRRRLSALGSRRSETSSD